MYFVFYSNIHINASITQALILNTETNDSVITNNLTFIRLYSKISYPTIYYMLDIGIEDIDSDEDFASLLRYLEDNFYGELFDMENRPIQFSPQVKINNNDPINISSISKADDKENALNVIGTDILGNILEISIYYNTLTLPNCYKDAYLQYLYPIQNVESIRFDNFDKLLFADYPNLSKVNFILGDFLIENIDYLQKNIQDLINRNIEVNLYVVDYVYDDIPDLFLMLFANIYVWYDSVCRFKKSTKRMASQKNYFLVYSTETLQELETLSNIDEIYPLYYNNIDFVEDYLSFRKEELLSIGISGRNILMNQYVNSNFFGELSIYPNGNVFSCKNGEPLGNIYRDLVKDMLMKEFCQTRYWFMTRNNLSICRDCIFNTICPPITSTASVISSVTISLSTFLKLIVLLVLPVANSNFKSSYSNPSICTT